MAEFAIQNGRVIKFPNGAIHTFVTAYNYSHRQKVRVKIIMRQGMAVVFEIDNITSPLCDAALTRARKIAKQWAAESEATS